MTPTRRTRKQQKKTEQPIESSEEESSEAGSVTRCVCGQSHSLGLMVQCDKCEVWQHCECMGLNQDKLPEQYFCDQCQPDHHQLIKISNGRSKRLYNAAKQGTNSDDDTTTPTNKRRKTTQRNKPSPPQPQLNDMALTEMVSTMTTITTTTTTTTIVTMTEEESETTTPEEPPILTRSRRIVKDSEDESKIKAPSPVQNEKKDEVIPSWNYKDGQPTGAITPPAKVKYPHAKMTFSEMNRRANQILECVSKMQVKLPDEQEDVLMKRARSLSTSSSSSSLSSASTAPLLDDYTTTSASSPSTPLPFIPKHQETSIDILERVNRELIKFQRKFGSAYSSFGNKVK